jgi:hypothetical protein
MPGGHEIQLPGLNRLVAAEAVAVFDNTVDKPGHGWQTGVRVRRHLHAGTAGDIVGTEVIYEAPGTDHAPSPVRQQPPDHRIAAQRHVVAGQQDIVGFSDIIDGARVHRLVEAPLGGHAYDSRAWAAPLQERGTAFTCGRSAGC